jgi:hypothetical protein
MLQGDVKKAYAFNMPEILRNTSALKTDLAWPCQVAWRASSGNMSLLRFLCVTWQCSQTHTFSFHTDSVTPFCSASMCVTIRTGEFSHVDQRLQEGWYLHDVISITGRESFVDQNRTTWAYHRSQLDPDPHSDYELLEARSALILILLPDTIQNHLIMLLSTIA